MSSFTIYDAARHLTQYFAALLPTLDDKAKAELLEKCAKKLGEEILETALIVKDGSRERVVDESADVLLRVLNVLAARGIRIELVEAELKKRVDAFLKKYPLDNAAGSP